MTGAAPPGPAAALLSLAVAVLAPVSVSAAAGTEHWTALSTTAINITGDVTLFSDRIVFSGGQALPIAKVRNIGLKDDLGVIVPATMYRVTSPADPVLLNGNRICGGKSAKPITYVTIWHSEPLTDGAAPGRDLAAYSGSNEPPPNLNATCGTFSYDLGT